MRSTLLALIFMILSTSCQRFVYQHLTSTRESEYVEICRENWEFKSNSDTIRLSVLKFEPKGRYDLVSWPNFIIGISEGDTIGVVDYDFSGTVKKGDYLVFNPAKRKDSFIEVIDSQLDEPVFKVNRKHKDNKLYCSVSAIYYGSMIE